MHVQINIIGRFKYVHSIVQQCREEKLAELERDGISLASILFNYGFGFGIGGGPLSGLMGNVEEALSEEERMRRWVGESALSMPPIKAAHCTVEKDVCQLGSTAILTMNGSSDLHRSCPYTSPVHTDLPS